MISLEINLDEVRKKNYREVMDLTKEAFRAVGKFEMQTKRELILIAAEKLEESQYPQMEIKETLIEELGEWINPRYLSSILPDRFKKPQNIAKGKKGAAAKNAVSQTNAGSSGQATVMEEPEQELDGTEGNEYEETKRSLQRDELPADYRPKLESETEYTTEYVKSPISLEYVESLEKQIKALGGEIGYQDCLATHRIIKLDKYNLNRLYNASAASKKEVVVTIDIRTNSLVSVYSDTDWKKVEKATKKLPQGEDHTKNLKG